MKYVLVLKELNNNQPQTANAVWGFSFFYFFWVGGPVGHKQRLYAKPAILARRESVLGVGGGWARRAQAQPTVV